jgi:hemerythrin superfamily protein
MEHETHANRLEDVLRDDHRRIGALGDQLLNPMHVNDSALAVRVFSDFERGLLAHLDVEERHMLPLLDKESPAEVAGIRAEHDQIRRLLAEIGLGLEIHAVREETIERLNTFLRAHSAREEKLLYRWADTSIGGAHRASILERLHLARPHRDAAA